MTDKCKSLGAALQASIFPLGEDIGRGFLWLAILFSVVVYLPFVGLTFHADDFFRIVDNFDATWEGIARSFTTTKSDGFYRPLNHFTFFLNYLLAGNHPGSYGFFNFLVYVLNTVLAYRVLSRLTNNSVLSGLAVCCWVLNYRASEMLLLWIVGRTELLYVCFCLLSLNALLAAGLSGKGIGAALLFFACALLAKETSVVFAPLLCLAVICFSPRAGAGRKVFAAGGICAVFAAYLYARHRAHGMLPGSAPDYYRFQYDLGLIVGNYVSYFFRSIGLPMCIIVIAWIAEGKFDIRSRLLARSSRVAGFLGLFAVLLLPVVLIPSRSNLYHYLPSLCLSVSLLSLVDYAKVDSRSLFKRVAVVMLLMSPIIMRYNSSHLLDRSLIHSLSKVVESKNDLKLLKLSEAERHYLIAALEIRIRERRHK